MFREWINENHPWQWRNCCWNVLGCHHWSQTNWSNSISEDIFFNRNSPESDSIIECKTREQKCSINSNVYRSVDNDASNQPSDLINQDVGEVSSVANEQEIKIGINANNKSIEPHEQAYSILSMLLLEHEKDFSKQIEEKTADFH